MKKYSRQREALLTELRSRKDHPTAEDLYLSLRAVLPNYSLGTVYRNLADLSADGVIMKITSGYGPERYDGNVKPHGHFTCTKCGRVIDLDGFYEGHIDTNTIMKDVAQSESGKEIAGISEIRIMLYGQCTNC